MLDILWWLGFLAHLLNNNKEYEMKIKYGLYEDTFYAPEWFLGLMHDVTHDGTDIWALVFGKWYIGIEY